MSERRDPIILMVCVILLVGALSIGGVVAIDYWNGKGMFKQAATGVTASEKK